MPVVAVIPDFIIISDSACHVQVVGREVLAVTVNTRQCRSQGLRSVGVNDRNGSNETKVVK